MKIIIWAAVIAISFMGWHAVAAEEVPHQGFKARDHYSGKYKKASRHKAFVIAPGGGWQWYNGKPSAQKAIKAAIDKCQKKSEICVPYDVDGKKVFDETKWASVLAPYPAPSAAATAKIGGKKGDLFPDLAFKTQSGEKKFISDYRGKILFVNIWTSWCPSCQTEMPSLNTLYEKYKNNPEVEFLIVGTRESMATSLRFVKRKKLTMPIYHTGVNSKNDRDVPLKDGSEFNMKKMSQWIPSSYLVDRNGVVIWREKRGGFDYWDQFTPQLEHVIRHAN